MAAPAGAAAATGRAVVSRWCEEWGDERPSRAMLERMAQDIDLAVAVAVGRRRAAMGKNGPRPGPDDAPSISATSPTKEPIR